MRSRLLAFPNLSPRSQSPGWWRCLLVLALLATAGCGQREDDRPRASNSIAGGRIVVVGARPEIANAITIEPKGFFEEARWDEPLQTLQLKGWAPVDMRRESVRFILRDPHDRLQVEGTPIFSARDRPDVAQAHPDEPEARHWGFTASIRLTNLPAASNWVESLELYCLADDRSLLRLTPLFAPAQQTWRRAPDHFQAVLMYASPQLTVPEETQGSLDVCEQYPDDAIHLTGWAPFDGGSPAATLIIQLDPSLGPASIVSAGWLPREDVRAAVNPAREALDRSGFRLLLKINGTMDDLKDRGAFRLWAIEGDQAVEVGLPALR